MTWNGHLSPSLVPACLEPGVIPACACGAVLLQRPSAMRENVQMLPQDKTNSSHSTCLGLWPLEVKCTSPQLISSWSSLIHSVFLSLLSIKYKPAEQGDSVAYGLSSSHTCFVWKQPSFYQKSFTWPMESMDRSVMQYSWFPLFHAFQNLILR